MGAELFRAVPDFFVDRLKVQQREAGVRHDLIDAVFGLEKRKDEIVGNLARVKALQAFMATDDGANLLAGYKRAANILKQAGDRSEEHTSELQSLMRISYAVFCLKKKNNTTEKPNTHISRH